MNYKKIKRCLIASSLTSTLFFSQAQAEDDFISALKGGTFNFQSNTRYEYIDDELRAPGNQTADALTTRTALGYKTGDFYNVFGFLEFENVTNITSDKQYNDTQNGLTNLPVIADPAGTEVNQAFIGIKLLDDSTVIKTGRQQITPRKAPFHRFLGTVLWRQNYQMQDAVTITNTSLPNTKAMFGYIWNNNFITGADRDMNAPIFNVQYDGFKYAKLEGYYYDIEFRDLAALSTTTYGFRANGAIPVFNDKTKFVYTGEYAMQEEGDNAPVAYDADYYLVEAGFKMGLDNEYLKTVLFKASYEVLESDNGVQAFRTPLGTNHAFQGWADLFLNTPTTGIENTYFTMVATGKYQTKLIVRYDMFEADFGGFDYGEEIGVWFTKKFAKNYTLGIKYAGYMGDTNTNNPARFAADLTRFWTYFTIDF